MLDQAVTTREEKSMTTYEVIYNPEDRCFDVVERPADECVQSCPTWAEAETWIRRNIIDLSEQRA